jgi:hypothetical protein
MEASGGHCIPSAAAARLSCLASVSQVLASRMFSTQSRRSPFRSSKSDAGARGSGKWMEESCRLASFAV